MDPTPEMDPKALEQARSRLQKAERSLEALKAATRFEAAEDAWTEFLMAAATIFSKLEQGAKAHPKSDHWFGTKKKQRREDPVLRYLMYARNSDEHGIERVTARGPENWWNGKEVPFGARMQINLQKVDKDTLQAAGEPMVGYAHGPCLELVPATNRGVTCDPPPRKIGEFDGHYPADVGDEALVLLRQIVDEAGRLP